MPQVVEVPGIGDVEFPDDMSDDQIAAAIKANMPAKAAPGPWTPARLPKSVDEAKSYGLNLLRGNLRNVGLAGRTITNAATSLPLLAMDAGVEARNLAGGNYELPSKTWNQGLDALGMVKPENITEKAADVVGQMALGGRFPAPGAATQAPANFVTGSPSLKDVTLQASQAAGYSVPPATAKPSFMNKALEGLAGKIATAQRASAKNQANTNQLAQRALGTKETLTPAVLKQIADDAHTKGYEPLRSLGTMRADSQYANDLAGATAKFEGASKSFPEAAKTEVTDFVAKMQKQSFDTGSALDMISLLRDKASTAYAGGDKALGGAYRAVSKALEGAIERGLARRGKDGAQLLKNFRDARQLIAKTHTVEASLNTSTGTVDALKIASDLNKGVPLTGQLKTIADFGNLAPKAAREFTESLPGISPLDFYSSGGLAAITKNPWYLGGPFVRPAVQEAILSPAGQKALTGPPASISDELVMSLLYGGQGLLSQ